MAENPVTQEEQEEEEKKSSGNTGLPFGLCKKYGIALPDNATPRMAWEALKNKKGITPNDAYRELKKEENEKLRDKVRQYSDTPNEDMEKSGLSESLRKQKSNKKISQLDRQESETKRIWQIQEYTGVSYDTAEQINNAIQYYTKDGFRDIRKGNAPKAEELIETFIERHPKYDGKIWRGIALNEEKGKNFITELKNKLSSKESTEMFGISSWTSAENVAREFSDNREGTYKILFELENQSGVGIDHLSEWYGEEEVIQSKKIRYKVKDIKQESPNSYKVILEEIV